MLIWGTTRCWRCVEMPEQAGNQTGLCSHWKIWPFDPERPAPVYPMAMLLQPLHCGVPCSSSHRRKLRGGEGRRDGLWDVLDSLTHQPTMTISRWSLALVCLQVTVNATKELTLCRAASNFDQTLCHVHHSFA